MNASSASHAYVDIGEQGYKSKRGR